MSALVVQPTAWIRLGHRWNQVFKKELWTRLNYLRVPFQQEFSPHQLLMTTPMSFWDLISTTIGHKSFLINFPKHLTKPSPKTSISPGLSRLMLSRAEPKKSQTINNTLCLQTPSMFTATKNNRAVGLGLELQIGQFKIGLFYNNLKKKKLISMTQIIVIIKKIPKSTRLLVVLFNSHSRTKNLLTTLIVKKTKKLFMVFSTKVHVKAVTKQVRNKKVATDQETMGIRMLFKLKNNLWSQVTARSCMAVFKCQIQVLNQSLSLILNKLKCLNQNHRTILAGRTLHQYFQPLSLTLRTNKMEDWCNLNTTSLCQQTLTPQFHLACFRPSRSLRDSKEQQLFLRIED